MSVYEHALQAIINQSIHYYSVISNPDVFCRREKSVKAQGGAINRFIALKNRLEMTNNKESAQDSKFMNYPD